MAAKIFSPLIDELIARQLISEQEVAEISEAAEKQNKDFGRILVESKKISDADLAKIKSEIYHLPLVELEQIEVDKTVLKEIAEDVVTLYKVAPFGREGNTLRVGVSNPEDINALEALKFIAQNKGWGVEKYVISYKDFDAILKSYRTLTGEVKEALKNLSDEVEKKTTDQELKEVSGNLEEITAEAPVTKIVAVIVKHAVESRASDIHIEPFEDRVRIRFRVDGILNTTLTLPKNLHSPVVTRIKIMSDLKIDETRLAQDGRFATNLNDKKIDFRVSTFPTKNGEKVVMRILDPLSGKITLVDLGIEGQQAEVLERGSGKSTTLAAMLKQINIEDINIVTLEDPIEYFVDGVNQSQVHEEIGYTFASGLRHILRQDPDVIMVGEIRDKETAQLATQAALTGHIVLSTLHTNDAIGVIPRLIDMGVEKYLIPPTVNIAAAQRLLRRLCPECKLKMKANSGEEQMITAAIKEMPKEYQELITADGYQIYKPNLKNPCKQCGGKAFKGRIGIYEMLEMTPELEKIILGTISETAIRAEAARQGMLTLYQDGILKVLKGVVSLDELLEVAQANDSA